MAINSSSFWIWIPPNFPPPCHHLYQHNLATCFKSQRFLPFRYLIHIAMWGTTSRNLTYLNWIFYKNKSLSLESRQTLDCRKSTAWLLWVSLPYSSILWYIPSLRASATRSLKMKLTMTVMSSIRWRLPRHREYWKYNSVTGSDSSAFSCLEAVNKHHVEIQRNGLSLIR